MIWPISEVRYHKRLRGRLLGPGRAACLPARDADRVYLKPRRRVLDAPPTQVMLELYARVARDALELIQVVPRMVHAPRETHQAQQLQQLEPAAATVQAHVALRHTGLY